LSSMEADDAFRIGLKRQNRTPEQKALIVRHEDAGAVAPPHCHAILGLAQIGNADGKPQSDSRQRDGKCQGGEVGQHAMAKIVGSITVALIAGEIVGLGRLGLDVPASGQLALLAAVTRLGCQRGAGPE
jgi:hypothetical protein